MSDAKQMEVLMDGEEDLSAVKGIQRQRLISRAWQSMRRSTRRSVEDPEGFWGRWPRKPHLV